MHNENTCKEMFERTILVCDEIKFLNDYDSSIVSKDELNKERLNLLARCFKMFCNSVLYTYSCMSFQTFTSMSTLTYATLKFIEKQATPNETVKDEAINIINLIRQESKEIRFPDCAFSCEDVYNEEQLLYSLHIVNLIRDYCEDFLVKDRNNMLLTRVS